MAGKPDIRERHRVIAPRSVPPRRHHLPEDPPGAVFKAMAGVHEIKSAGLFLIGSSRADGYTLIRKANELAPKRAGAGRDELANPAGRGSANSNQRVTARLFDGISQFRPRLTGADTRPAPHSQPLEGTGGLSDAFADNPPLEAVVREWPRPTARCCRPGLEARHR